MPDVPYPGIQKEINNHLEWAWESCTQKESEEENIRRKRNQAKELIKKNRRALKLL